MRLTSSITIHLQSGPWQQPDRAVACEGHRNAGLCTMISACPDVVPYAERPTATLSLRLSTRGPFVLPRVDRSGATGPNRPSERLFADVAGVGVLGLPSDVEINLHSDERLLG